MKKYKYLIVGAGLAGALSAYVKGKDGSSVCVIEKKPHVGGFCYSKKEHGIEVHKYGAHIFRTDDKAVWDFVNNICEFVPFVNSPIANYHGELYNLPINMNTLHQLFSVNTPEEAMQRIQADITKPAGECSNMEEVVLAQCGRTIYEKLIKGYSEKQWGRKCTELPIETMAHIPIRMTYDNNYYDVKYQGIPICGYTEFIERMLEYSDLYLRTDFFESREYWESIAENIIYTGRIDEYFGYCFGELEYRSVKFVEKYLPNNSNYQGVAVMNFTDKEPEYTRCIEHKHFLKSQRNVSGTILSYEYPSLPNDTCAPIYPVRDAKNLALYNRYKGLAQKESNVTFFGQLADYVSYNMSHLIEKII
jgi:UDP-galactopyranose mutase